MIFFHGPPPRKASGSRSSPGFQECASIKVKNEQHDWQKKELHLRLKSFFSTQNESKVKYGYGVSNKIMNS